MFQKFRNENVLLVKKENVLFGGGGKPLFSFSGRTIDGTIADLTLSNLHAW